ncbi:protein-glutamate O-methyltransferase CheR [Rapidithrix thailandica]|uniref:Protein-glutamate O-methyltransferase CheR n=1 Tax=Rapidithrix thailandica TaxID=413964 RepID=A0AAW9SAW6_9BACT
MEKNLQEQAISDFELVSFCEAIYKRYGIDFSCYEPTPFKRRLKNCLLKFKFNSLIDLWSTLLRDRGFIYPFMNEITVGLTTLFRDPKMWLCVKDLLLQLTRTNKQVSILHTGCSTGEELFSMAILAKELGVYHKCRFVATDINEDSLQKARMGEYCNTKWADFESNYRQYNPKGKLVLYCLQNGNTFQFDPLLLKNVEFKKHNLIADGFRQKFHLIFCRNVLIYFDKVTQINIVNRLHDTLESEGFVVMGYFDSVMPIIRDIQLNIYDLNMKIFNKASSPT